MGMKKIFWVFLLVTCAIKVDAQESKLVGTWEGTYTIQIPDPNSEGMKDEQRKMIIRIKLYDEEYVVKVKSFPVKDPNDVKYWNDCNVSYSDEATIKWTSYIDTSYDWDSSDKKNGQIIKCVEYTEFCSVTVSKGRLNFIGIMHSVYKNRNDDVIGTHDTPAWKVTLYKEDDDW